MKQEQVRPIRGERRNSRRDSTDSDEYLWPLSPREFLRAPSVAVARKSFRYRLDDVSDAPQSHE